MRNRTEKKIVDKELKKSRPVYHLEKLIRAAEN